MCDLIIFWTLIGPLNVLYVAEPEKIDPAKKTNVYHLKVHFGSTTSRGKGEPEVTKEKGKKKTWETLAPLGLLISIMKVSYMGSVILEVVADRLKLSDGLLGLCTGSGEQHED